MVLVPSLERASPGRGAHWEIQLSSILAAATAAVTLRLLRWWTRECEERLESWTFLSPKPSKQALPHQGDGRRREIAGSGIWEGLTKPDGSSATRVSPAVDPLVFCLSTWLLAPGTRCFWKRLSSCQRPPPHATDQLFHPSLLPTRPWSAQKSACYAF